MLYRDLIKSIYKKWKKNKASRSEIYFFAGFLGINGYNILNPTDITKRMIFAKMSRG